MSDEDRQVFLRKLQESSHLKGFAWLLSPSPPVEQSLPAHHIANILQQDGFASAGDKVAFVCRHLPITDEERRAVADVTKGQASNPQWSIYRKGRVTASNFGRVLKTVSSHRKPSPSLIKTLLGQYHISSVHAVQWGVMHESTALDEFTKASGSPVEKTGIWLAPSGKLGASPDGFVGEDGIVEVKCPYSARSTPLKDLCEKSSFLKLACDGSFELNLDNDMGWRYYHQVQGNLYFTCRQECTFIVWTPAELQTFQVAKDPAWEKNIAILEQFYVEHFLPAFLNG